MGCAGASEQTEAINTSKGSNHDGIDKHQRSALHRAAGRGDLAKVQQLLQDPDVAVDLPDYFEHRPLHCAAANGHTQIVQALLEARALVNARGVNETCALHWAAGNGHIETVQLLLNSRANVHVINWDRKTALCLAQLDARGRSEGCAAAEAALRAAGAKDLPPLSETSENDGSRTLLSIKGRRYGRQKGK
eukprot:TRINITY_DN4021_c0_g1_i3.p1 TRINITY_DN4021_c0_g1~~TRINITY_DN4021_c0_g1_i3.p1  ORF type:complete len:191 (-),score=29.27 TRINITY_DN4021_c0_g1_i3:265-837(-)